jgi:hypothetical protein
MESVCGCGFGGWYPDPGRVQAISHFNKGAEKKGFKKIAFFYLIIERGKGYRYKTG